MLCSATHFAGHKNDYYVYVFRSYSLITHIIRTITGAGEKVNSNNYIECVCVWYWYDFTFRLDDSKHNIHSHWCFVDLFVNFNYKSSQELDAKPAYIFWARNEIKSRWHMFHRSLSWADVLFFNRLNAKHSNHHARFPIFLGPIIFHPYRSSCLHMNDKTVFAITVLLLDVVRWCCHSNFYIEFDMFFIIIIR